jgi:hypothetical protein
MRQGSDSQLRFEIRGLVSDAFQSVKIMQTQKKALRYYLSLILLFVPAVLFTALLCVYKDHPKLGITARFPFLPWQFLAIAFFGVIATIGGVLDWRYHRNPLNLKISKKEREAEAAALGLGGVPMFVLMWCAMMSANPAYYLIPILVFLIYTVTAICYDEFVFHLKRCGKTETLFHRMLVFGNGIAWLSWFHFIFVK